MDQKSQDKHVAVESKGLLLDESLRQFLSGPNEIECQEVKWSYDAEGDHVFIRQPHFDNTLEIILFAGLGGEKKIPPLKVHRYQVGYKNINFANKKLSYYYKVWYSIRTQDGGEKSYRLGIFAFENGSTKIIAQPGDFSFSGPMKVNKWSWKKWIGLHDADEMEDAEEGWEKVSRRHELIGFTEDGSVLAVEPAEAIAFQWKMGSPLYIESSV